MKGGTLGFILDNFPKCERKQKPTDEQYVIGCPSYGIDYCTKAFCVSKSGGSYVMWNQMDHLTCKRFIGFPSYGIDYCTKDFCVSKSGGSYVMWNQMDHLTCKRFIEDTTSRGFMMKVRLQITHQRWPIIIFVLFAFIIFFGMEVGFPVFWFRQHKVC